MFTGIILLLIFSFQHINCQLKDQTIPSNFEKIIRQQYELLNLNNLPYINSRLEELLTNILLFNTKNTTCEQDIELLIQGVLNQQLWALKILDSWGKPLPSGLLKGNVFWAGNYDECSQPLYQYDSQSYVKQPFETQYCKLLTYPSNAGAFVSSSIVIGLCLPSSCHSQSIVSLVQTMLNDSINLTNDYLHCSNDHLNEKNNRLIGTIIICIILSILIIFVLIATIIDLIIMNNESLSKKIWIAEFSALRSLQYIFNMEQKKSENSFHFINGIRVLALFYIIFCHSFLFGMNYTVNNLDVISWSHNFLFQLITSAVLNVDTFFVLSGFLTAILFVRQVKKEKLSRRFMFLYYIHRYIRLTPTFIIIMFMSIYLTPYFGYGPAYPSQQGFESEECRKYYWWTAFFYIGNLIKPQNMCLNVSWYLFNDMQFHWVAPLILIPFVLERKKLAYIVGIIYIFISMSSIFGLLLYYPHLNPNNVRNAIQQSTQPTEPTYFNVIYVAPWCRISAYAIGLLTGFLVINKGRTYSINSKIKLIGNLLTTSSFLVCIFSMHGDYNSVNGLNRASIIAYDMLSRPAWSLAVGWIIFLCSITENGIVNKILSWPIWIPLTRLNYATYLIHLTIIYIIIYNQTMPFYYQPLTVINNYVSQLFLSYVSAIPIVIFLERPFFIIEKKLFKR
ncbi:unnamed protein product [Adineta steineri]|uniref:Nose resistant-to-fluoxetine protein N-terminal domain-containing protein n=1 Tax=Adineta steineri TaxID=433720 RepID=A0A819JL30_9BILA|nr:unnamed protein product [Adineta steineri]CAF3930934.1 unnamed protein product [Adineta steineri]